MAKKKEPPENPIIAFDRKLAAGIRISAEEKALIREEIRKAKLLTITHDKLQLYADSLFQPWSA